MKIVKYIIIAIFFIVVAKWIIELLPSSYTEENSMKIEQKGDEVKINISFKNLDKEILQEFEKAQDDIDNFIVEQFADFGKNAKYNLSKEDGFLDWLFGWGTGYKMMYHKGKSLFGSEDNEIKLVEEKFKSDVLQYEDILKNIEDYSKNRIEDFYKSSFDIVQNDVNKKFTKLDELLKEYKIDKISNLDLPWGKYITQLGTNSLEATTLVATDTAIATIIGAKVATVIGPKVLGIVTAKTATIIAGKVASATSLLLAPIIDYGLNEGVKILQKDSTQKEFEKSIDEITVSLIVETQKEYQKQLIDVSNEIDKELNKTIIIKGEK